MHPLPPKFFGPSGIPCVFAIDDAGNTAIGYITHQLGVGRFRASNGTVSRIVNLAQNLDDVADLNHLPPGKCTILVEQLNGSPENICRITTYRCSTIQGHVFPWHSGAPTARLGGIIEPTLDVDDPPLGITLENGDFWMLEPLEGARLGLDLNYRGFYLSEVTGYFELFQDGSQIEFEDDSGSLLLETAP